MNEYYNHHYIRTDASGNIVEGWSDGPNNWREPAEDDILLTDKGGYQFRLFPNGEENPPLYTADMIPLYRWDGTDIVERTEEEIAAADRAAVEAERAAARKPSTAEIVDALLGVEGGAEDE